MSKLIRSFRSRSIGFLIITACVGVVLILVLSILVATLANFTASTREAVNTQTRELSAQIVYNYDNYIGTIIDISNIIQTDVGRYDLETWAGRAAFGSYLADIAHLKNDIVKIALYDLNTWRCLTSSDEGEIGRMPDGENGWFSEAVDDPTVHVFSGPYSESAGSEYKVNISKQIKTQQDRSFAVLKIEISFDNFIALANKSNLGDSGHITIIDPEYSVIYSNAADITEDEMAAIQDVVLGSLNVRVNGRHMSVNVDTLSNTKWRICVFVNIDKLAEIQGSFLGVTVLVAFGVTALGILLFSGVSRIITDPLEKLEQAMQKVEQSDYFRTEELDILASREVGALVRRFNRMMTKISELMDRVIAEQAAQRRSELRSLQNQINPHFLYNTLDSIVWLVENNKNAEAAEMVVALAKLFRVGISKDREVISVRDELEHVRNYLLIQSIRYSDSFDYSFEVDERALDCMTMKLILQPIVENCIYHGLKNKIDRGHIAIRAALEGETLILSVADNGYGMRQEAIDRLYELFRDGAVSDSVGLKNIYQRVMIYYEKRAEMQIESELDEGTTITIKEPVERE